MSIYQYIKPENPPPRKNRGRDFVLFVIYTTQIYKKIFIIHIKCIKNYRAIAFSRPIALYDIGPILLTIGPKYDTAKRRHPARSP